MSTKRPLAGGRGTGTVDVENNVTFMTTFRCGTQGTLTAANCLYGKRVTSGSDVSGILGPRVFDWQRLNELQLNEAADADDRHGVETIIAGPDQADQPYGGVFWPVPAFDTGFSDSKVFGCSNACGRSPAATPCSWVSAIACMQR